MKVFIMTVFFAASILAQNMSWEEIEQDRRLRPFFPSVNIGDKVNTELSLKYFCMSPDETELTTVKEVNVCVDAMYSRGRKVCVRSEKRIVNMRNLFGRYIHDRCHRAYCDDRRLEYYSIEKHHEISVRKLVPRDGWQVVFNKEYTVPTCR